MTKAAGERVPDRASEPLRERASKWTESDLRKFPTATLELIDALVAALAIPSAAPADESLAELREDRDAWRKRAEVAEESISNRIFGERGEVYKGKHGSLAKLKRHDCITKSEGGQP